MNSTLKYILIIHFFVLSCLTSCSQQIKFVNESDKFIDSVAIAIKSKDIYVIKFIDIKPGETRVHRVPYGKPESNNRDISVNPNVYIKGMSIIYAFDYNDLTSFLKANETIVFGANLKLSWRVERP